MELLFLFPILGVSIIIFTPSERVREIKLLSLFFSFLTFFWSIRLWSNMVTETADFQFLFIVRPELSFAIDGISIWFILLSSFLIPICILSSWDSIKFLEKQFYLILLIISILLTAVFSIQDLLGFYIFFEAVLIPMFLMIGVWGAREQKITASYYFFFYTLAGSLLMLLSILYIYNLTGTTNYLSLLGHTFTEKEQSIIFLAFFASLAVKIPKFPFHIWLPLAHVEAPLAGSILLAGILIKLGSYGFIRFTIPLFPFACEYFAPLVFVLSILAIIYASITTITQTDLKRIIAYSSVGHMAVVTLGIFTLTVTGIEGSIFLQLAHGLVSSGLFIVVTVLYDRHHTRILKYYRGVTLTMPIYSSIFLFLTLANIAIPLSCNFIGEFLCLLATFEYNTIIGIFASFGMVLSACYGLFLYNRVCFGSFSLYIKNFHNRDINRREFFVLFPILFFTLLLGIVPNFILENLHVSILAIL